MEYFKGLSLIEFVEKFKSDDDCKAYLSHYKWLNGFKCSKCVGVECWVGVKPYTKVCKNCRHVESITSGTLFHKVKFGLRKAFMIVFEMSTTTKSISSNQMSKRLGVKYDTAWLFMKKVRVAMSSSEQYPMEGKVYVDEFVIGGFEAGAVGRKKDSKKIKAIMAVEVTDKNRIKRVYSMKIPNYSSGELGKMFKKHISENAEVKTDEWKGYNPLKKNYNLIQDKSIKNNSPVNRMIQQLKSWIRGTHHWISDHHAETYLNEFSFRINRSQWKESIFTKCIERMMDRDEVNKLQLSKKKCMSRERLVEKVKIYESIGAKYEIRYGRVRLVA